MTVERYTWEDAVIDAQAAGLIPNGALMVCLKLARAINWKPTGARAGMPSGLYWANEEALASVGCSRASYFKYRELLFEMGFFTEIKGNLIPQVPDLSLVKTGESLVETTESLVKTEKSLVDNPYSEDTYTDDVLSVDVLSEDKEAPVLADAPTITSLNNEVKECFDTSSFNLETLVFADGITYTLNTEGVTRESLLETDDPSTAGVLKAVAWNPYPRQQRAANHRAYADAGLWS